MNYTQRERTEKTYTVGNALRAAEVLLKRGSICIDVINKRDLDEKITLVEMNEIVDQIVSDTNYYG